MLKINQIYNADCIGNNGMILIPDKSIDMILCDLPYGQTKNDWDVPIPADKLWEQYSRIIKDNGVIALTATFAFGAELIQKATVPFRYDLIWRKNSSTGHLNSGRMPLRQHEVVLIFYKKLPVYHPQKTTGHKPVNKYYTSHSGSNYGASKVTAGGGSTERFPTSVIDIPVINNTKTKSNATQKPVELYEWLIKTYTNEGDIVLDNACGSGTIGISCINTKRQYIGFEKNLTQYQSAVERIETYKTRDLFCFQEEAL